MKNARKVCLASLFRFSNCAGRDGRRKAGSAAETIVQCQHKCLYRSVEARDVVGVVIVVEDAILLDLIVKELQANSKFVTNKHFSTGANHEGDLSTVVQEARAIRGIVVAQ